MNLMQKMARSCKIHELYEFEGWESISVFEECYVCCVSARSLHLHGSAKKQHHGVLLAGLGSTEFTQDSCFHRRKIADRLIMANR